MLRLRFPLNQSDQLRIDPNSIQLNDVPYSATPTSFASFPQGLQIQFSLLDPNDTAWVRIRPLTQGDLWFFPDAGGQAPDPSQDDATFFAPATYATWQTVGTLVLVVGPKPMDLDYSNALKQLGLEPNILWYSNVKLPLDFLDGALTWVHDPQNPTARMGLIRREVLGIQTGARLLPTNDVSGDRPWAKNMIAAFLAGRAPAHLSIGATASDDDALKYNMPAVNMSGLTGDFTVTMAVRAVVPHDSYGPEFYRKFYSGVHAPTNTSGYSASAPDNGAIPARLFFQLLGYQVEDTGGGSIGTPVGDKAIALYPNAPRYFSVRYSRYESTALTFSWLLPLRVADIQDQGAPGRPAITLLQRLPNHGVVLMRQDAGGDGSYPIITVKARDWLSTDIPQNLVKLERAGNLATTWLQPLQQPQLTFDLSVTADERPHVTMRSDLGEEIARKDEGGYPVADSESLCSYFSMRRAVRSLIDNRLAGGRYAVRLNQSRNVIDDLILEGLDPASNTQLILQRIFEGPTTNGAGQDQLRQIEEALWHTSAVAFDVSAPTKGRIFYYLWQNRRDRWGNSAEAAAYDAYVPTQYRALGGAGAMAYLGLGVVRRMPQPLPINRDPNDPDAWLIDEVDKDAIVAEFNAQTDATITGLRPGAVMQVWEDAVTYLMVKDGVRQGSTALLPGFGHSVTFQRYMDSAIAEDAAFLNDKAAKGIVVHKAAWLVDHRGRRGAYVTDVTHQNYGTRQLRLWKSFREWELVIAANPVDD